MRSAPLRSQLPFGRDLVAVPALRQLAGPERAAAVAQVPGAALLGGGTVVARGRVAGQRSEVMADRRRAGDMTLYNLCPPAADCSQVPRFIGRVQQALFICQPP